MGLVAVLVLLAQQWVPRWWPTAAGGAGAAGLRRGLRLDHAVLPRAADGARCACSRRWCARRCRWCWAWGASSPALRGLRRPAPPAAAAPEKQAEAYQTEILATVEEGEREATRGAPGRHDEKVGPARARGALDDAPQDMDAIPVESTVGEARALALRTGRSRYPVVDGDVDHVVGVVHVKDLLRVSKEEPVRRAAPAGSCRPASRAPSCSRSSARTARTSPSCWTSTAAPRASTIEDVLEQIVGDIDEFDLTRSRRSSRSRTSATPSPPARCAWTS
jgi:hypothetical protein